MADLPSGMVTFLFTDIEGSTPLWEHEPEQMRFAQGRHDAILRTAIAAHGGRHIRRSAMRSRPLSSFQCKRSRQRWRPNAY